MNIYTLFKKYKVKIKNDKIFDPIRNKFVALTPEESIRQKTISFLLSYMNIPADKLCVEIALSSFGLINNRKRIDIGIFDNDHELIGIVECKANYIGYGEAPYIQALDYVLSLGVKYYFVVDGEDFVGYHYDSSNDQFVKLESIPVYNNLLSL